MQQPAFPHVLRVITILLVKHVLSAQLVHTQLRLVLHLVHNAQPDMHSLWRVSPAAQTVLLVRIAHRVQLLVYHA